MRTHIRSVYILGLCILFLIISGCGGTGGGSRSSTASGTASFSTKETSLSAPSVSKPIETITASSGSNEIDTGIPVLKVEGNKLCNLKGDPVQLRGISTHGLAWFPQYVNESCIGELKSWGANVVRLAMYTAEYGGYCTGGDKTQLKNLIRDGIKYEELF